MLDLSLLAVLRSQNPCQLSLSSLISISRAVGTNLPLGELELSQAAALGSETRAIFQRPADGTGSNGEVAVVAMDRSATATRSTGRSEICSVDNVRQTGSFPGSRHFDQLRNADWRVEKSKRRVEMCIGRIMDGNCRRLALGSRGSVPRDSLAKAKTR